MGARPARKGMDSPTPSGPSHVTCALGKTPIASHHPPTPPYKRLCPPPRCGTHTAASGRRVARTAARSWTVGRRRTVRSRAYCRQLTTGPRPRSRPSTGGRNDREVGRCGNHNQITLGNSAAWQQRNVQPWSSLCAWSVGRAALTGRGNRVGCRWRQGVPGYPFKPLPCPAF